MASFELTLGNDTFGPLASPGADTIDGLDEVLTGMGFEVDRIGHVRNLAERLVAGDRWDFVFNICEGVAGLGREAQVPCLLDAWRIPYVFSDPLTLSLRTAPWRFTWQSGLSPFTYQAASQELLLEFVNINRARGGVLRDEARHNPELVVKYTDQLRTYIRDNAALSKKTAPPGPGPAVGAQP